MESALVGGMFFRRDRAHTSTGPELKFYLSKITKVLATKYKNVSKQQVYKLTTCRIVKPVAEAGRVSGRLLGGCGRRVPALTLGMAAPCWTTCSLAFPTSSL